MYTVTAAVEWIDEEICVTHVSGRNLPAEAIEPLMEWALALELGCGIEELGLRGWESRPDGLEEADPGEWVLDWNNTSVAEAAEGWEPDPIWAPDDLLERPEKLRRAAEARAARAAERGGRP